MRGILGGQNARHERAIHPPKVECSPGGPFNLPKCSFVNQQPAPTHPSNTATPSVAAPPAPALPPSAPVPSPSSPNTPVVLPVPFDEEPIASSSELSPASSSTSSPDDAIVPSPPASPTFSLPFSPSALSTSDPLASIIVSASSITDQPSTTIAVTPTSEAAPDGTSTSIPLPEAAVAKSQVNKGAIAGGVIAGLFALSILAIAALVLFRRRRKLKRTAPSAEFAHLTYRANTESPPPFSSGDFRGPLLEKTPYRHG